jgi:coenzyme F420-reducing hydrogenase beta subunit
MVLNNEGFLYPNINVQRCSNCGKCQKVCPIINKEKMNRLTFQKAYAAWCLDEKKRTESTSGGIFNVLSDNILKGEGYVVGASFNEDFYLAHTIATCREESRSFCGSKYLQSDTRGIYLKIRRLLEKGETIMFSGLPCQVDALKRFLPEKLHENLITCELLCHGVPSPGIFADYIKYLENKYNKKIISYNFRSKKRGWNVRHIEIDFEDSRKRIYKYKYFPFHSWFGKHLSLRNSCFFCQYRTIYRNADITLGDFWGVKKIIPDIQTNLGVSLVYINTLKGANIIANCSDQLYLEEVSIEKSLEERRTALNNFPKPELREIFMKDYKSLPMEELVKKYPPTSILEVVHNKIKRWLAR